jgi:hypothetical protein
VLIFRPIVEPLVLAVLDARHDLHLHRSVKAQFIHDHDDRHLGFPLQELARVKPT